MKAENKYDNIVIHYYPKETFMKVIMNFRKERKIIISTVFKDLDGAYDYMANRPFCNGMKYRIITHNLEMK